MSFYITIAIFTCITLLGVSSVFLLTGLTGLFSFGHAGFMAIGAYISGIAVIKYGLPFWQATILGVIAGGIIAVIIGYPTLKLRKDYFSLVTFGFGETVAALLNHFVSITGGAAGMAGIPRRTNLALALLSIIIVVWIIRNFKFSRYGRMCIALRNDELVAKSFGIDVFKMKIKVFICSAMIASYAGVLYGFFTQYVEPVMFGWTKSAEWVIIVFLGGMNSLTGAVFSGILLTALPEALRFASEYRIAIYCILIIFTLNFRTKGIFGEYELNLRSLKDAVKAIKVLKENFQKRILKGEGDHENIST